MPEVPARHLIALLNTLKPMTKHRISDLAITLGVDEIALTESLKVLAVCGVAPYDPDDCLPLIVQNGWLLVTGELPGLRGPVRLSGNEARALAAALRSAGFSADDGLLARLLTGAGAADFDPEDLEHTIRSASTGHSAEVFGVLAQAIGVHDVVHLEYARAGASESSRRAVEPSSLYAERSAWYLTAWCRQTTSWRTFRVDRIRSASPTGERFEPRTDAARSPQRGNLQRLAGLPAAVLRFGPDAQFLAREWPGAVVTEAAGDGALTVEVPYGGTGWIARHVVARLGGVEVLAPEEVRRAVGELAASELATHTRKN
ncbi:MAG: WYL domain-containing protein [Coriobacteriia bacterium]|nr:WYL domain-containing protein [Coriobacteriia bacterium]